MEAPIYVWSEQGAQTPGKGKPRRWVLYWAAIAAALGIAGASLPVASADGGALVTEEGKSVESCITADALYQQWLVETASRGELEFGLIAVRNQDQQPGFLPFESLKAVTGLDEVDEIEMFFLFILPADGDPVGQFVILMADAKGCMLNLEGGRATKDRIAMSVGQGLDQFMQLVKAVRDHAAYENRKNI